MVPLGVEKQEYRWSVWWSSGVMRSQSLAPTDCKRCSQSRPSSALECYDETSDRLKYGVGVLYLHSTTRLLVADAVCLVDVVE
jgi:hypothetical protein